jgi:hypothetical protein
LLAIAWVSVFVYLFVFLFWTKDVEEQGPDPVPKEGELLKDIIAFEIWNKTNKTDVTYVGTPERSLWHQIAKGGTGWTRWALSEDHRYLAVGLDVLDRQTCTWQTIPIDMPSDAYRVAARWAPGKNVLGLSFSIRDPSPQLENAFGYGFPFYTWEPAGNKVTKYDSARIVGDFHWLTDGQRIIIHSRAPNFDDVGISLRFCDLRTDNAERRGVLVLDVHYHVGKEGNPVYAKDVHFDLSGYVEHDFNESVMCEHACENPRTGDVVETLADPDRVEIRRKGEDTGKEVARFKHPFVFAPYPYPEATWSPRWLSDDRHVILQGYDDRLTIVDTTTGKWRDIAKDVRSFSLLDPDLYEMRRHRFLERREWALEALFDSH